MKRNILAVIFVLIIASCAKNDCNGDLDGTWQMISWQTVDGTHQIADKTSGIYWHFKLSLLKTHKPSESLYYLSYFKYTSDSIIIEKTYRSPYDEPAPLTELSPYGVPVDGKFRIEKLDNDYMLLRSSTNRLSFRKY